MHELISKAFSSSLPSGKDCKYEDSFFLIEQEVDKNNSVTQDGRTDWEFVVKNCESFLINESKDLKIASWLIYGLWKNDSWDGLKNGLSIYNQLLIKFEKSIYPKSKKAKTNIFTWIEESLTNDIISNQKIKNSMTKEIEFLNLFKDLNTNINTQLEVENNNFRKIIQFIENRIKEKNVHISKEKNLEKDKKKNEVVTIKNDSDINNEITTINNNSDAIKVLRNFKKNGSLLTDYYRKTNISNLKALRITRLFAWLDTEGLPNSEAGKTFLHPPSELELDELEELYKNKEYEEAFFLTEEILEVSPFWIDGHLYSYNILEKTKNYEEAKEVKNTLLSFLKTNKGILDLSFVDNTPFASNKAKKWVEEELISKEPSNDLVQENTKNDNDEIVSIAYDLANDNKIKEAMHLLNQKYFSASNTEKKFNWRLHHAELAIEFDKKEIALALLEELEKDIEKFHLNEWNPKLASKVYNLLLTSFSSIDIHNDKLELIYKNLCKTDINSAFEIKIN